MLFLFIFENCRYGVDGGDDDEDEDESSYCMLARLLSIFCNCNFLTIELGSLVEDIVLGLLLFAMDCEPDIIRLERFRGFIIVFIFELKLLSESDVVKSSESS